MSKIAKSRLTSASRVAPVQYLGPHASQRARRDAIRVLITRFGTVTALVIMIVCFETASSGLLLRSTDVDAILNQSAPLGLLAVGLTICLILGQFDLSIGYTATLAGMISTGLIINQHLSWLIAVVAALAVSVVIGLVNGFVVTRLRVNALVATLAMGSIIQGILNWYSISPFVGTFPKSFLDIGESNVLGVPTAAIVWVVVSLLLWIFLQKTAGGRRLYAIGGNEEAAQVAGIRIRRMQMWAFVLCALCAGISGIVLASQLNSGQPSGAIGLLLSAFAGAFLGSATWREGEFHIAGTVIGVVMLGVIVAGLAVLNAPYWLNEVITGLVLIAAVAMGSALRKRA